jgi:hypothetical protein
LYKNKGGNMNINEFEEWLNKGRREVNIKLSSRYNNLDISIWVYDYDLQEGQYVKTASEINLEKKVEENEYKEYQRLKSKFGECE